MKGSTFLFWWIIPRKGKRSVCHISIFMCAPKNFWYTSFKIESKHLKGQLGPRVGDVTFFNHGGQLGPCVGDVTFFNHGGQLGTCVGDVTFFNHGGQLGLHVGDVT